MTDFIQRGYVVKETGAVYFTENLDKTAEWFEKTLGWYHSIDGRDAEGNGMYGCVYDIPTELEHLGIVPFHGFHILNGEPKGGKIALIKVAGIDALRNYVIVSGWNKITGIKDTSWARTCDVTTPDGYIIEFFE